jgi:hypothetical protein
MIRKLAGLIVLGIAATVAPGVGVAAVTCPINMPQGSDPVTLDPADFVAVIDNPYLPMAPGSKWVYREVDTQGNEQRVVVKVKTRTREIIGITATVVRDTVTDHGDLVEDTFDWYGQDVCGNVWYLGENTKEYEGGTVVSTAGSWEAGVDGAQPGVVMPADPQVGLTYRQEYYAGEAEDNAKVLSIDEQVEAPIGHFSNALLTKELTPVEPTLLEYKLYASGVGMVVAVSVSGGSDRDELVSFEAPAP